MFKKHGVCNVQFLKQNLAERQKDKDSNNLLAQGVTDDLFQNTLKQIGNSLYNSYFLKTLNNPEIDKYRDVVIETFANQVSLKKADIREAAQKKLGHDIPAKDYHKILKELAYCKGANWIFKSGNGTDA